MHQCRINSLKDPNHGSLMVLGAFLLVLTIMCSFYFCEAGASVIFMYCRMGSIETTSSVHNQEKGLSLSLPRSFLHFLEENGLDPSIYAMIETIPRYIR